jgi:ribosomal protein L11 methyltransferase
MKLYKLSFPTTSKAAPIFGEVLDDVVLAASWYEIDEEADHWILEATLTETNDSEGVRHLIKDTALLHGLESPQMTLAELPDTDWLEQTWKNFPRRQIGKFFIYGSHAKTEIPADLIGLEINAATAFGSGEHETTTACIEALTKMHHHNHPFKNPLDMGCGSGILAMVIAKLWDIPVLAVDNDPESVRVAAANAQMNDCTNLITTLCNEGFAGTAVKEKEPFDLIAANILAAPLCDMAPDMAGCVAREGRIVLSGLLTRQINDVRQAYEAVGFKFIEQHLIGDWAALVLER